MAAFSDLLRRERERAGMSQERLAEEAGLHRVQVNRLEAGRSKPTWETVQALARALGCSCEKFMEQPPRRRKAGAGL